MDTELGGSLSIQNYAVALDVHATKAPSGAAV